MIKFSEFLTEGSDRDYVDNRFSNLFKKEGLNPSVKKEIGYTEYSLDKDTVIINDGVGISVKHKGKEIEYFDKPKMDYSKAMAKALDVMDMNESMDEDDILDEGIVKIGDTVVGADGQLKGKKGKVLSVKGDMAQIDFGNGDKYGITLGRIKDGKVFDKPVNEASDLEKEFNKISNDMLPIMNAFIKLDDKKHANEIIALFTKLEKELNKIIVNGK